MKNPLGLRCLLLLTVGALTATLGAQIQWAKQSGQKAPDTAGEQNLIRSLEGADLYNAYCASCHGKDGKGNGPVVPALKASVPDLTLIANRNGGTFPTARIRRIIEGEGMILSHGSREMPVWGPIFHQVEADVDLGNVRIKNLIKYLQSIQTSQPSKVKTEKKPVAEAGSPGEKLYSENCAACHGEDLKGTGPAPAPFNEYSPDLTTLAKRHGGKFPEQYVTRVLTNGVNLSAHGPAEMPAWGWDFRARDQFIPRKSPSASRI